jgi:ubiquinone/menaquinone biosynthesis C-methylase UbiE
MILKPFLYLGVSLLFAGLNGQPEFSYKTYGNIANYFESETDFRSFFEFKKGDVVAEIGAGNCTNAQAFALLTDSVTFYMEDIDPGVLNRKHLKRALAKVKRHRASITSTFRLAPGNEKATLLPGQAFDKVVLVATFHELYYMDDMLVDLHRILKPGGKLFILESHCCNEKHKNYTAGEAKALVQQHGFALLKQDGKDLNGGKGVYRLIFAKQ